MRSGGSKQKEKNDRDGCPKPARCETTQKRKRGCECKRMGKAAVRKFGSEVNAELDSDDVEVRDDRRDHAGYQQAPRDDVATQAEADRERDNWVGQDGWHLDLTEYRTILATRRKRHKCSLEARRPRGNTKKNRDGCRTYVASRAGSPTDAQFHRGVSAIKRQYPLSCLKGTLVPLAARGETWVLDCCDCLDGNEHARNVGAEAGHRARRLRAGKELRIDFVHFLIQVGADQQHRHLHDTIERTAGRFQDRLHVAQRLPCLLLHRRADDFGGTATRFHRDLPRHEYETIRHDGVRIGRVRGGIAGNVVDMSRRHDRRPECELNEWRGRQAVWGCPAQVVKVTQLTSGISGETTSQPLCFPVLWPPSICRRARACSDIPQSAHPDPTSFQQYRDKPV